VTIGLCSWFRGHVRPAASGRPTIYELNAAGRKQSPRELARLAASNVSIVWHAARRELITMVVLEVVSGIGVAAEVVVGRHVAEAVLETQRSGAALAAVWPSAVSWPSSPPCWGLRASCCARQRMMTELTQRHAQDRMHSFLTRMADAITGPAGTADHSEATVRPTAAADRLAVESC
jgi:hypothetical protein